MFRDPDQLQAQAGNSVSLSLKRIFSAGVDLLFPPRCAGCGRVDTRWCAECQAALDATEIDLRRGRLPPFAQSAATGIHEGKLQQAVHALKYADALALAAPLAQRMATSLIPLHWTFDLIAPVPLHPQRLRERGYNQSALLADALAKIAGIPCDLTVFERVRDTPPQVGRSRKERQANVAGAFTADSRIAGAAALVIDDVFTTGATLQACARAALDAGAGAVYSLTVTVARSPNPVEGV